MTPLAIAASPASKMLIQSAPSTLPPLVAALAVDADFALRLAAASSRRLVSDSCHSL